MKAIYEIYKVYVIQNGYFVRQIKCNAMTLIERVLHYKIKLE